MVGMANTTIGLHFQSINLEPIITLDAPHSRKGESARLC